MPEAAARALEEVAATIRRVVAERPLAGAGFTGLTPAPGNAEALGRFTAALGL